MNVDLPRLASHSSEGWEDVAHLRTYYGGDLVTLFGVYSNSGGLAYLGNYLPRPGSAFSVVRLQEASWTYTFVHEMAHNMGSHHSRLQTAQAAPDYPDGGFFPHSVGWYWVNSVNE